MEYLNLTANSSILKIACAVCLNRLVSLKMWVLLGCLLLSSLTSGQVLPYGPTALPYAPPLPFARSVAGAGAGAAIAATVPTAVPSVAPTVFPFGPTTRSLIPGAPGFNNPYYNPAAGPAIPILTYSHEQTPDGTYAFSFTTADGKQAQESGYLKDAYIDNAGQSQGTQVVTGSYAYIAPDGTPIQVSYVADENGFRPSGVHIPADGNAAVPSLINARNGIVDPLNRLDPYNRYDPYNRNQINGYDNYGSYKRPYDPRYPYDATRYNNRPLGYGQNIKAELKKQ